MSKEHIKQEFRLKNIDETWNRHSPILVSVITGYFSTSTFASLLNIPIVITS